jgi:uroporphyrinogen decarboxylase
MRFNMSDWRTSLLESSEVRAMPIMTYPGLALTNRTIMEMVTDAETQVRCVEALAQRYPAVAALTVMDLSCEAEAFGSEVQFSEKEVPTVIGQIVSDLESAHALQVPRVGTKRTSTYLETAELAVTRIKDRPVLAGSIGPFSLAGRLIGMNTILLAVRKNPQMVHVVLEKCTTFLIDYLREFKKLGTNGVVIAEPAAGLLSPSFCTQFSSHYVTRIVAALQDDSFSIVLHNCGNTVKQIDSLLSTGVKALHLGNSVDLSEIMPQVPSDVLVFGNIEPAGTFKLGSVEDVRGKVKTLLQKMELYPNFVLSSGCDIPPESPIENLDVFFQTLAMHNGERAAWSSLGRRPPMLAGVPQQGGYALGQ